MRTTIVTILCMIIALFSLTNQGAEAVKLNLLREDQPGFLQIKLRISCTSNEQCGPGMRCFRSTCRS